MMPGGVVGGGIGAGGGLRVVQPRVTKEGIADLTEQQRRGYMRHVANADHFMDQECSMCDVAGYPLERRLADARQQARALVVRRFGPPGAGGKIPEVMTPVLSEHSREAMRKKGAFAVALLAEVARLAAEGRLVNRSTLVAGVGGPRSRVERALVTLVESGRVEARGGGCKRTYAVAAGGKTAAMPLGRFPLPVGASIQ